MLRQLFPLMAAGLLIVSCASSQQPPAEAPDASTADGGPPSGKVDAEQDPDPVPEGGGSMIVTYQDATTPEAIAGRDLMQGNELLEDFADDINQTLNLPYDIQLHGTQCDQANAFWSESENTITICYEDASNSQRIFTEAGDPDPDAAAINAEYATFYHEVGHMAISVYDLPVTGREEDVADQLAAYILLTPGDDGQSDPESVQAVKDFARVFNASGAETTEVDPGALADEHSLDMQRVYNLDCWIYGSNPDANADLVTSGQLPEDRADGCQAEWEQLDNAWSTLLDPYFK
ncbi:Uncharacterised protein [Mycolicibacterium aurum]|uniref:Metalloprotease n=1 Tax=Mycolicibacterium aurum TaxID=1791 RepID=A0A3S4SF11_MYCAU|nr:DUF4344 domain-containing metallopeptidase [Mycolicibacterium aurum]VEG51856.1 Uncharacterised protein [Mycolicibacterium aurum]